MKIGGYSISQVRKAVVAGVGALVMLIVTIPQIFGEWLPEGAVYWINVVVGVLTAIGVFLTRNAPVIDKLDEVRKV